MSPPKDLATSSQEGRPSGQGTATRDTWQWAALELQAEFNRGSDARQLFTRLLGLLLEQSRSEYGFISEVLPGADGSPRLQVLASTPPGWMDGLRPSLAEEASRTLTTGKPALLQGASAPGDGPPSSEALPVSCFLALPLEVRQERVGLIGLANSPSGYKAEHLDFLQPLLTVAGSLLHGWRAEQRQRQTEEALRQTQANAEHMSMAMASVGDGLWDWKLPTQELYSSRRFRDIVGYTEDELEPTVDAWSRLCHPEDFARLQGLFREHLRGSTPLLEFTYRARRKDGTWAWILCRAKVVTRDEEGRAVRVMGTDFDITAQKETEERLSALIQAIPDLLFRMSADGTFIDYNSGNPEPTVLPPSTFLGKRIQDLPLPKHFVELTLSQVNRVIREGTMAVYEYQLGKPTGLQHYEARAVRSGPDEAVCIVRNITERKLAEERQAQLIQAEKLALMGQLAAGVAHEINNPVSYVTSNLRSLGRNLTELTPLLRSQRDLIEALGPGDKPPPAELLTRAREVWARQDTDFLLQDMTDIVRESLEGARRIKEIAQGLRTFSREEAEQPQEVDLNAELEATLRIVWNELKYKCEVKRDFGQLPSIACYPTQLAQVFTNLLVNAAQAIAKWGEIRIRTRHEGSEVVVCISDTGQGMAPETLAKLATPFFTTKPRGQGTGLGLYISYGIIARHKGRIDVQSEQGKGTTFTLYLPLTQDEQPASPNA